MKKKTFVSATVLASVLFATMASAPSFASGTGDDPTKAAIEAASQQGVAQTTTFAPSRPVKPIGASPSATVPAGPGSPYTNTLHDTASKPAYPSGGSSSSVTTGFTTSAVWTGSGTSVTFNGSSYARWLGNTPLNANKVVLSDHFWNAAVGITSVNISSNPSVGLAVTGSDINYSNAISNSWQNNHYFSGWKFSGLMFSASETSQGAITIGSSTWIVSTP